MKTILKTLNDCNGADELLEKWVDVARKKFIDPVAVLMGIAYGGDVEMTATHFKKANGRVFGYDTFSNGHPKHLAKNVTDFEATCMEHWYQTLGTDKLSYVYQMGILEELGLDNVILIEGEVDTNSCDFLDKIHLAWLDMDLLVSMENGFNAVKDNIVKGGYLITHDVEPRDHISGLYELFFDKLIDPKKWALIESKPDSFFTVWQRV